MNKNTLIEFLELDKNLKGLDLSCDSVSQNDNKERIKKLFDVALEDDFILYFDGRYVIEPYDGYEFETEEEEFYYNNGNAYLVFRDETGYEVSFKIKNLKEYQYDMVYEVVKKAVNYTKSHPEVSEYTLY